MFLAYFVCVCGVTPAFTCTFVLSVPEPSPLSGTLAVSLASFRLCSKSAATASWAAAMLSPNHSPSQPAGVPAVPTRRTVHFRCAILSASGHFLAVAETPSWTLFPVDSGAGGAAEWRLPVAGDTKPVVHLHYKSVAVKSHTGLRLVMEAIDDDLPYGSPLLAAGDVDLETIFGRVRRGLCSLCVTQGLDRCVVLPCSRGRVDCCLFMCTQTLDSACSRRCDLRGFALTGDVDVELFNMSVPATSGHSNMVASPSSGLSRAAASHYNSLAVSVVSAQGLVLPRLRDLQLDDGSSRAFVTLQIVSRTAQGATAVVSRGDSCDAAVPGADPVWTTSRDHQVVLPFPSTLTGPGTLLAAAAE